MKKNENIKCIMDYFDRSLIKGFNALPENIKDFRNNPDWSFVKRESLDLNELIKPWGVKETFALQGIDCLE